MSDSDWWSKDPVIPAPVIPAPADPAAPAFWHADPVVAAAAAPPSGARPLSPAEKAGFDQFLASRPKINAAVSNATAGDVAAGFARGLNQNVDSIYRGMPFSDRLEAGADAIGQAVTYPWTGQAPDYAGNLKYVRDQGAQAKKANPIGETIGNFAGGMLMPAGFVGNAIKGVGTAANVARGAAMGAFAGGLGGLSTTPDLSPTWGNAKQAALNTASGAIPGAVLGGIVPAIGGAVGGIVRRVAGATEPSVEGIGSPAVRGINKIIDASGGEPVVSKELSALGPEGRLLDASPALGQLATGVATGTPGTAGNDMVTALQARQAAAPARLAGDINTAMGPFRDAQQITDALTRQKTAVSSALPTVYHQAPPVDIQPVLSTLDGIKAPDGSPLAGTLGAIRRALTKDAAASVPQLPSNPTAAEFRQWQQASLAAQQAGGRVPVTDAETLHRAKEMIDGYIEYASRGLGPLAGSDATSQGITSRIRSQLDDAIRGQVPGYAQTMDKLSSLNQQQEAIQRGAEESLRGGSAAASPYTFERDWQRNGQAPTFSAGVGVPAPGTLSQQQAAQQIGMRDAMERAVGTKGNDLSAVRNILQGTPDPNAPPGSMVGAGYNLQNIGTAFGDNAAKTLADALSRENRFAASNQAVYQGSQTGARLSAQKAAEGPPIPQIPGEVHNITHPAAAVLGIVHGGANAALRSLFGGSGEAYKADLARLLSAPNGSKALSQILANNAAKRANDAMVAPVASAASKAALIPASALSSALLEHQRRAARVP